MRLGTALRVTAGATPEEFGNFTRHLEPAWIEEALETTDTWTVRKRRLPAVQVVWLIVGMALFRDLSIAEVVRNLDLALPTRKGSRKAVAPSAIPKARERLGDEAMQWLFEKSGNTWAIRSAKEDHYRGLGLYGVDGTAMEVADTIENRAYFGGPITNRGPSGYPLLRAVALMALRSHLLVGAAFGAYNVGEGEYASRLWSLVPDSSLVVLDRLFLAAATLIPLATTGTHRHWLTRAKSNTKMRVIEPLGPNEDLVELNISPAARKKVSSLPDKWIVRAIRYQRKGFRPQTLLTSLLDPTQYPADEVIALYHERWELELGYDEVKTELLERRETLRSKSPKAVRQEMWGVLLVYNLIRLEMERVAAIAGVPPVRISFVIALRAIRNAFFLWHNTSPGALPDRIRYLEEDLRHFILPPRRPERAYPRAVKVKMSKFKRKRPTTPATTKPAK
jgi:hypothetical protein